MLAEANEQFELRYCFSSLIQDHECVDFTGTSVYHPSQSFTQDHPISSKKGGQARDKKLKGFRHMFQIAVDKLQKALDPGKTGTIPFQRAK